MPTDPSKVGPALITRNPSNPRRYFNDQKLDLLRTSVQEVGILVPLIVYSDPAKPRHFILMDGERRWLAATELALDYVPVNVIPEPTPLENLLRMFNIHAVREEWPLISVALSLQDVMKLSGERGEARLAQRTGLTRSTVRRARRLLSLPKRELDLISAEAHLERAKQVHREDLYLEIEAAESVIRNSYPEATDGRTRADVIRQFARKRESGALRAVTEFRDVGKLVKAADEGIIDRKTAVRLLRRLIQDDRLTPSRMLQSLDVNAYRQEAILRKARLLISDLKRSDSLGVLAKPLRASLQELKAEIARALKARG